MAENQASNQPILVTGAHRSGTTWVGKMLAANGRVAYISEPLNVFHRPGVMRAPVGRWYTYICADNEAEFLPAFQATLALDYQFWMELRSLRTFKDPLRMLRDSSTFMLGKIITQRVMLKDPFAVFSAGWFAQRLGCRVVVVVRHPAAFVSSLVRLGWDFDLSDLLDQTLLMRDWLEPFRTDLEKAIRDRAGGVAQASLLWSMIYAVVDRLSEKYPDMILVRHEQLSLKPEIGFHQLYLDLGLDFNSKARAVILDSSAESNPKQGSKRAVYTTRLDSVANLSNWKRRLAPADLQQIHAMTSEVASRYYSPNEWE